MDGATVSEKLCVMLQCWKTHEKCVKSNEVGEAHLVLLPNIAMNE